MLCARRFTKISWYDKKTEKKKKKKMKESQRSPKPNANNESPAQPV